MDTPSPQDLVSQAQAGCQAAFGKLTELYGKRLRSFSRLHLGAVVRRSMEVDDVLQETWFRAYRSLADFKWSGSEAFFSWLGGIAEHVIVDEARKQDALKRGRGKVEPVNGERVNGNEWADPGIQLPSRDEPSPLMAMVREERFLRLEKAINSLSEDYRKVIILARVRGLPIKDIAGVMDRSADAVSMLLLRALRELRIVFGETASFRLPAWWSLDRALPGDASTKTAKDPAP